MFDVSLKLDHSLPFCGLSKEFPSVSIQRWCNLQVDILEIQSPREEEAGKVEPALRKMLSTLGARLIRFNRYSSKNLEAVIGCRCAVDNSTVARIEWAGCIPVMPVNYHGGQEYCRVLAFTKNNLDGALSSLSKVSKLEIESKSVIPRESARGAITVPVDEFLGTLTKKQLAAFIIAMQMGYYGMPKGATIDEIASKQGMKRSTYEEHLRKAELKILQAVRPYARLAYVTSKGRE
jgi:predicted DNA binding protein